ncbi:MAG: hypothetical protein HKM07_08190 [Chlamydiae bacterium]|nr:hypothetical protein [Chlamydiota bacterium]
MSGTREGGLKSAKTIKAKYGEDFFKTRMGSIGGKAKVVKGYASTKVDKNGLNGFQRAKIYGSIAGQISRRKTIKGGLSHEMGNKISK